MLAPLGSGTASQEDPPAAGISEQVSLQVRFKWLSRRRRCITMATTPSTRPVPTSRQLQRLYALALERVAHLHESLLPPHGTRDQVEHARESRVRLQQLDVILHRIRVLHSQEARRRVKATALNDVAIGPEHYRLRSQGGRIKLELGIQAEAFYYLAHRATKCIQYAVGSKKFLPIGVRDVRNHLIEHPKALHWDFQYHKPEGVVMKPFRHTTDASVAVLRDAGLFLNAEEFARALIDFLPASARGLSGSK